MTARDNEDNENAAYNDNNGREMMLLGSDLAYDVPVNALIHNTVIQGQVSIDDTVLKEEFYCIFLLCSTHAMS